MRSVGKTKRPEVLPTVQTTILLYFGLCLFRCLNTLVIQSYFDPDEYWQTLEPAYCEVFLRPRNNSDDSPFLDCAGYTWEWKRRHPAAQNNLLTDDNNIQSSTGVLSLLLDWLDQCLQGPIRSYISVLPTHVFYKMLQAYNWDTHFWVSQGPKLVTAVVAAAPTDLAVWYMAHYYYWMPNKNNNNTKSHHLPWWCLFCSMVSWFHGYALIRTFSNSLETMLLSVSMALIAPEILGGNNNTNHSLYVHTRHCLCFLLGGLSVAMRFSGVTAWIPMGILLAIFQTTTTSSSSQQSRKVLSLIIFLIRVCAVFGILGIAIACIVDRHFYGFWTVPFLGSFHFNVLLGRSALYGSHPWHWYFTAGIPAITGLWLPFVLYDGWQLLMTPARPHDHSIAFARRNVWIIIAVYTLAHSMSGHKEFRFLMPILPLFCLLAGPHVQSFTLWLSGSSTWFFRRKPQRAASSTINVWPCLFVMALSNLVAVLYLGLFHQSAPISVNHKIAFLVEAALSRQKDQQPIRRHFSIHYLTGGCHSTPLHSYLHVQAPASQQGPAIVFDTWSLDCSPDCRSNPNILCESEAFVQDPVNFVEQAYDAANPACTPDDDETQEEESCVASAEDTKSPPDFLVTYPDYASQLRSKLVGDMGLVEVGRFSHGINGIRVGSYLKAGDGFQPKAEKGLYRRLSLFGNTVELSIDEMILYASPTLLASGLDG